MTSITISKMSSLGLNRRRRQAVQAAMLLSLASLQGCAERKPHAFPWATAVVVKPRVPVLAPQPVSAPDIDVTAPDLRWDVLPPSPLAIATRGPARPHSLVAPPVDTNPGAKPESFSFAPQLSEQEVATARQQVNDSIAAAQKDLASAKGRRLNTTQTDMATKVNAFIDESRGAAHDGDWNRARNLAKKAQVLAEELAGSL